MSTESTACEHYAAIARAIALIDESGGAPIPLEEVARKVHMSPSHFQRLFSKWAGVSPKKFQEYLALGHARTLLRGNFTVLDTAYSVGLSGPGRLHDLFLRWEAMTPGEFAGRGRNLKIRYGWFDSPFGELVAMGTKRGLCGLAFCSEQGRDKALADLRDRFPFANYVKDPDSIGGWVRAAIRQQGESKFLLVGTPFQIKVWEALLRIPSGHVTTYSEVSRHVGRPTAVRATGSAVGRNPLSWLIPCHRVIQKTGGLGGYHWGLPVKRRLLAWESARLETAGG